MKDIRVHLDDIVKSCTLIEKYTDGKSQSDLENNTELLDMVTRRLEIIGEAVKRLPQDFRDQHQNIPWKNAAGMRDVLIHAYDEIDEGLVWRTVMDVLPEFRKLIEQLPELQNK